MILSVKNEYMLRMSKKQKKEVIIRRCSVKKVLLKILQNSQESTCIGANVIKKRL